MLKRYKKYESLIYALAIFDPKGWVASEQKELIIKIISLLLVGAIPALFMAFFFVWKYRASRNEKYSPTVDRNLPAQFAWAGLLIAIICVLASFAIKESHRLDPRKSIAANKQEMKIQAVALEWKWLFIYPEQNIATVNYIQFPEDTPIVFEITADAPMNSLWIPQLGGQMYAMNGMKTQLHLMADEKGTYRGVSNNISGEGFAGMKFDAVASSQEDFDSWVKAAEVRGEDLSWNRYQKLAEKSRDNEVAYFKLKDNIFNQVLSKYMSMPAGHDHQNMPVIDDRKIFKSEKYGYEFKYPKNWTLESGLFYGDSFSEGQEITRLSLQDQNTHASMTVTFIDIESRITSGLNSEPIMVDKYQGRIEKIYSKVDPDKIMHIEAVVRKGRSSMYFLLQTPSNDPTNEEEKIFRDLITSVKF
ncbi:MAG: COX aromatic rich motif-containing protein [Candidatus Doudnabacteria bacterium]|nr:COX aromatic rich motif-containing protein [Candidatus Doudnabacteria bacterium]